MNLYFKNQQWHAHTVLRPFRIYTKLEGKLAQWQGDFQNWQQAIKAGRDEVGMKHRGAVLVVIK